MKIKIFLFTFLLFFIGINLNAQHNLYKEVKSGMTEKEFISHIEKTEDLSWFDNEKDFVRTSIKDRLYVFAPVFNKNAQIQSLLFYCVNTYEYYELTSRLKPIALEIFKLFNASYGEPTFDEWPKYIDDTSFEESSAMITTIFEKPETTAMIILGVTESGKYRIGMLIFDSNYIDKEEISSEGF